ncbi:MAG: hypothetical protein QF415_12660 [Candidatus Undinarchaeales archaeon]|jgi:hypothetical protein|nr:hypothetical protein [Candidatus Undinarchaeales archaeon]MDP7492528.1 hypothetical protein [Candidatus Undinarchaeales archaeon]
MMVEEPFLFERLVYPFTELVDIPAWTWPLLVALFAAVMALAYRDRLRAAEEQERASRFPDAWSDPPGNPCSRIKSIQKSQ